MINFDQLVAVVLGLIFFWLVFLSVIFYNLYNHYQKLSKGLTKKGLKSVLEELLKNSEEETKRVAELLEKIEKLEKENLFNIQKIGLVRFNPFSETGGNQSFSLALLDGQESGFVITSLHSREITRMYAKEVKKGKQVSYELSAEEKRAVKSAKKIK
jgi:cell division protein FtsB